jgi:hypothetical protein
MLVNDYYRRIAKPWDDLQACNQKVSMTKKNPLDAGFLSFRLMK